MDVGSVTSRWYLIDSLEGDINYRELCRTLEILTAMKVWIFIKKNLKHKAVKCRAWVLTTDENNSGAELRGEKNGIATLYDTSDSFATWLPPQTDGRKR